MYDEYNIKVTKELVEPTHITFNIKEQSIDYGSPFIYRNYIQFFDFDEDEDDEILIAEFVVYTIESIEDSVIYANSLTADLGYAFRTLFTFTDEIEDDFRHLVYIDSMYISQKYRKKGIEKYFFNNIPEIMSDLLEVSMVTGVSYIPWITDENYHSKPEKEYTEQDKKYIQDIIDILDSCDYFSNDGQMYLKLFAYDEIDLDEDE